MKSRFTDSTHTIITSYDDLCKGTVTSYNDKELVSAALQRVRDYSNLAAAGEIGVSEGTIRRWREGNVAIPLRTSTRLALRRYLSDESTGEAREPEPEAEDLFANYDQIVKYVGGVAPPGQDQAVKRDILEGIRRAITATRPLPRWWHELKEKVDRGEL